MISMENTQSNYLTVERNFSFGYVRRNSLPSVKRDPNELTLELRVGHQQLSEVCSELIGSIDGNFGEKYYSPTLYACKDSLRTDAASLLDEANLLLENVDEKRVTSLRASLAQVRVDSYLETIQSALRLHESLDSQLNIVTSSIASQMEEEKIPEDLPIRISTWRTPSLCFDMEVGKEVEFTQVGNIPLKVKARVIAEVYAKDINAGSIPSYRACRLQIKELTTNSDITASSTGVIGNALTKIVVSPLKEKREQKVESLRIRECRVFQENAFPPLPTSAVDLFVSTKEGTSDITIMLNSKIHRMLHDQVPELRIELVMAGDLQ